MFIDSIRGISPYADEESRIGDVMRKLNSIVCDQHGASLVYLDHWNKAEKSNLLDKSVGITAKTAAVRAVYSVEKHSETVRTITCAKMNVFGHEPPTLRSAQGPQVFVIYCDIEKAEYSAVSMAEKFLIGMFTKQTRYEAVEVFKEEAEAQGISEASLDKAKQKLAIKSEKPEGTPGTPWFWVCDTFRV